MAKSHEPSAGFQVVTDMSETKGLYKSPDSRYWWMAISVNGTLFRESTKCRHYDNAKAVYSKKAKELNVEVYEDRWTECVHAANDDKGSWLWKIHQSCRRGAKRRDLEFQLSMEKLRLLALNSRGYCQVTGIKFSKVKVNGKNRAPFAPSLDRIDSSLGYTYENCRLVCMIVNFAMMDWGEEAVRIMAKGMMLKLLSTSFFPEGAVKIDLDEAYETQETAPDFTRESERPKIAES